MKIKRRKKKRQKGFFDRKEWWEDDWEGMPEYFQQDKLWDRTIHIHFKNNEDVQKFAKLVKQKITSHTKYIWYPEVKPVELKDLAYTDSKKK
jgi:hypothetical protein